MIRHTKIVATLGPASSSPQALERLLRAGVDVVRLNFSHGKAEDHIALADTVRQVAARLKRPVGILADLQGPKIRIGKFENRKTLLKEGDSFILDAQCTLGNQARVGLDYKDLPHDVNRGSILLLDDGRLGLIKDAFDGLQGYAGLDQPTDPGEPGHVSQLVVAPPSPLGGNRQQPQRVVVAHRAHRRPGQLGDLCNAHGDSLTRRLDPDSPAGV